MTPKRRLFFGVPPGQWLAVFIIIVLMYAILFPVFQHVQEHNPRFSCQSRLKQISLAYAQYLQDGDDTFPAGTNAAGNGWAGKLYPYTRSTYVYRCPDDPANVPFVSYAENQNVVRKSISDFANPAGTVTLYEFTTLNCDPSKAETISATGLSAPQDSKRHDSPQYPFGLNFLLADGHVKMLTPGQVSNGMGAVPPTRKGNYLATFAVK